MGTQTGLAGLVSLLIVLCADFKIALRMVAGGADLGSLCADDDVPAVAALPDLDFALRENLGRLDIVQQCAVALLMVLLNGGDEAELLRELMEALFIGSLGKAVVHIRPLVVLALGGGDQILGGIADAGKLLEPELGVLLFILGGLEEERGYLLIALLLRDACEIGVFIACLRFAGKCGLKVLLGLRACLFCSLFHSDLLSALGMYSVLMVAFVSCTVNMHLLQKVKM